MPGSGFKTFTTGQQVPASEVQGYLMLQTVAYFASAAARDAALPSPEEGQHAYLADVNYTTYYTGSEWLPVGGWTQSGSFRGAGSVQTGNPVYVLDVRHAFAGGSSDARVAIPYGDADALVSAISANHAAILVHNADSGDAAIVLRQGSLDWAMFNDATDGGLKFARESDSPVMTIGANGISVLGNASINGNIVAFGTIFGHDVDPVTDNTYDLGAPGARWDDIYATNGTIQTSDERFKTHKKRLNGEACLDIVRTLAPTVISYKRPKNAQAAKLKRHTKPDKTHWGFGYQRLVDALDGEEYAITVETDDIVEVDEETGKTTTTITPNGARYEEAVGPLTGAVAHVADLLDAALARIADLEAKVEALGGAA